jgi:hypothetical protein
MFEYLIFISKNNFFANLNLKKIRKFISSFKNEDNFTNG